MTEKGYMSDIYKQLEQVMHKCDSLSSDITLLKKENKELNKKHKEEIKILSANYENRISSLEKTITEKDKKIEKLENEVDRLKSQIDKDSNNSSKPPSSDIKPNKKDIPNNRVKSGKRVGGQKGHKGSHLSKEYVEENIANENFNHIVKHIGTISDKYVSKYILDISVQVNAIEYRFYANENGKIKIPKEFKTDVQYGPDIKTLCTVLNVNDVVAIDRLTDFVSLISHGKIKMSNGTIVNIINKLSNKLTPIMGKMRQQILNSKKLNTDATSARCNNRNVSVRNYSTDDYTLLCATKGKSKSDLEETGILPQYQGTLIHDHETVMYNYGNDHVECNVHVTRYLTGNYDITKNKWPKDMISFLCNLNNYKKELILKGINEFSKDKLEKYFNRYDEIIREAREQNKKVKSIVFKHEEKKLINRLEKYKANHLKFISNFAMPFDNNLSERELRHVKTKQKISGAFNSMEGLQNYLNIKSIIITCKKKGIDFYTFLSDIFENKPVTI